MIAVQIEPATPSSLQVTLAGQPFEVFMSYALLNRLLVVVGNPENVAHISTNPQLGEAVVLELLTPRSKMGKPTAAIPLLDEVDMSITDHEALLQWAQEHLWDFLVRALEKTNALQTKHKAKMADLTASLIGSLNSPSTTLAP